MSRYKLLEVLGKGSYGTVHRAIHCKTHKEYAVKSIDVRRANHYQGACVLTELRVLASHACPYLVAFKEVYVSECGVVHLVTELAACGDLAHEVAERRATHRPFVESDVWHYALQLCLAVHYLHGIHVVHRDIKPANILLDERRNVKLADLGIAKILRTATTAQTQIGTPYYMSPEMYRRERYGYKNDVWAIGCVLFELVALQTAFHGRNVLSLRDNVVGARMRVMPHGVYATASSVASAVRALLQPIPRHRPTMAEFLARPRVREELTRRQLSATSCAAEVKPLFHTPCAVPQRPDDWQRVVALFCELNTTIRLDRTAEERLAAVSDLRHALATPAVLPAIRPAAPDAHMPLRRELSRIVQQLHTLRSQVHALDARRVALVAKLRTDA